MIKDVHHDTTLIDITIHLRQGLRDKPVMPRLCNIAPSNRTCHSRSDQ